jgi:hypothetical protein
MRKSLLSWACAQAHKNTIQKTIPLFIAFQIWCKITAFAPNTQSLIMGILIFAMYVLQRAGSVQ